MVEQSGDWLGPLSDGFSIRGAALTAAPKSTLSIYVHVPFCARRCGYCDFNTYTAADLGGGASRLEFAELALAEVRLAAGLLAADMASAFDIVSVSSVEPFDLANRSDIGASPKTAPPEIETIYFGGGTPTMLPTPHLIQILNGIRDTFGLKADAEVSIEANPDTVTEQSLTELAQAGFTRVSFGMQSAVPKVLEILDRTHNPVTIPQIVDWATNAGLKSSLDLIYGTPGESLKDWQYSVEKAIDTGVEHISAYALTISPNTKMSRQIAKGHLTEPDDDDLADKYELADELLTKAGFEWYEVSNWARGGINGPNACQHNLAYWHNQNWWGIGPGAHSHLNGTRFWNQTHPKKWAEALTSKELPIEDSEQLTAEQKQLENIFLNIRLASGIKTNGIKNREKQITELIQRGLIKITGAEQRIVLTRQGRLLADTVVRALT